MLFVWLIGVIVSGGDSKSKSPAVLLANALLFVAFYVAAVVLHELGHAVAARLAGGRVHGIDIGTGGLVFQRHLLGMDIRLHASPFSGGVHGSIGIRSYYRLRMAVATAGGPLVNLLIVLVAARYMPTRPLWEVARNVVPIVPFVAANAFGVLHALIPRSVRMSGEAVMTDGARLIYLLRLRGPDLERDLFGHPALMMSALADRGDWLGARALAEAALLDFPDLTVAHVSLAAYQLSAGDVQAGAMTLRTLLQRDDLDPMARKYADANMAMALACVGGDDSHAEAEERSLRALESWATPPMYSIRAMVLIARGEVDAGLQILRVLPQTGDPIREANGWATVAYLLARSGRAESALEWLGRAEAADSRGPWVRLARAEIAS